MSMSGRFRILTAVVIVVAIATAFAAGGAIVWTWTTPGVHPFFRIVFPPLTAWLIVVLVRLALALRRTAAGDADDWVDPLLTLMTAPKSAPDAAMRAAWPDAEFCQRIVLPPDPGISWWLRPWRHRVALRIGLPQGHRLVVAPASWVPGNVTANEAAVSRAAS